MKLLASIWKELLLLFRDPTGLTVLFVMPAILVVVMTLVQENTLESSLSSGLQILYVDLDQSDLSRDIEKGLTQSGSITLIRDLNSQHLSTSAAMASVGRGEYQVGIIIPSGLEKALKQHSEKAVEDSFQDKKKKPTIAPVLAPIPEVMAVFNPTSQGDMRAAIKESLKRLLLGLEMKEKARQMARILPEKTKQAVRKSIPDIARDQVKIDVPAVSGDWSDSILLTLQSKAAVHERFGKAPSATQQNVPAWALFGMFFIVVPLAGTLLREKTEGTLLRLLSMPISPLIIVGGKVLAYVLVCAVQFGLILAVGVFLLPLLGAQALDLTSASGSALAIAFLVSALAATGYGIMIGAICRTYEQASMFGAVSIVIAAAFSGIMVPVYVMPKAMQNISVFSPLFWALTTFLDILVRGAGLREIGRNVLLLAGFFGATLCAAWVLLFHRSRTGQ